MSFPPFPSRPAWAAALALTVIAASHRSAVAAPSVISFDKVAHFCVYGLLATLVQRALPGRRAPLVAVLVVSLFGVTDEVHQAFVPGRSSEVADWVADTLGAILATSLYAGWGWYRTLLERPLVVPGRRRLLTPPA